MNALKGRIELTHHFAERQAERAAPANQNVIVTLLQASGVREPHQFTQAAADAVALDGIACLPGHREAYARAACIRAPARL